MRSVIVLLSTYNGERYLRQQIDSLLNQKNVSLRILARDDGSNDATMSILKEYADKHDIFSYYQGENCGPAKSFLDLISKAEKADYYALCDQDDVWDSDKLYSAILKVDKLEEAKPNLYYSNLRIVDENLKFYRLSHSIDFYNDNKYSALTENLCTGCTAVFNYRAKTMISKKLPDYCSMHDTWIYMVCKIFGKTVYDEKAHISYRQHGNNVVGTYLNKSKSKILKTKIKRLFNRELQPRYMNAVSFYNCFETILNEKDKTKILKIVNYKKDLRNRILLFMDNDIKASTKYGNLRFRLHVIWGTV